MNGLQRISFCLPHGQTNVMGSKEFVEQYVAHQVIDRERVAIAGFADDGMRVEHKEYRLKPVHDLQLYCRDRFQSYLSAKPIEFNVKHLTIQNLEELSCKYMEQFGSSSSVIVIQKLNKYLKLVAIIDAEAFRIYRTENSRNGELVELAPHKWVVGKFEDETEMFKKMMENARYAY